MKEKDIELSKFSEEKFLDFIDEIVGTDVVRLTTSCNWFNAVKRLLSVATESERENISLINAEDLCVRYDNLHNLNKKTLNTYRTRFKIAIMNFKLYVKDPSEFKQFKGKKGSPRMKCQLPVK